MHADQQTPLTRPIHAIFSLVTEFEFYELKTSIRESINNLIKNKLV